MIENSPARPPEQELTLAKVFFKKKAVMMYLPLSVVGLTSCEVEKFLAMA